MRKIGIFLALLAFIFFVFLGFQVAKLFAIPGAEQSGNLASGEGALQYNYLIIHVDHLDHENPTLISMWGAFSYQADPASLSFLPLYPTGKSGEKDLVARFSLSKDRQVSASFIEKLQEEYDMEWNHVVIIDQEGVAYWTRFLTGGDFFQNTDSTGQTLLQPETDLLKAYCSSLRERGSGLLNGLEWNRLIPDHLNTDITLDQLISEWDRIQKSGLCDIFGQ